MISQTLHTDLKDQDAAVQGLQRLKRTVLKNGIVILVVENPTADIVATRCFLKAGTTVELPTQAGLVHLATALLTKGTINYDSQAIAEQVESAGASLGTESATEYFLLSFKTVAADFLQILTLAAELLRSPTFPEHELELERRMTLQAIKSQQERPFSIAYEQLQHSIYGNHPYGMASLGTLATVSQIQRADLIAYHQTYFRPDQMVISIAGRVNAEVAIAAIAEVFGDWQAPSELVRFQHSAPAEFKPETIVTKQDTQQAIVMLGYRAPAVSSSDFAAMKLITTYLGNGLSSRLFVELREKKGLAYEVSAFYPTRLESSQFVCYMGTDPKNTSVGLAGLKFECDRLTHTALSTEELQTVKNKILGQYALGKQTNSQIAQVNGYYEILGLGAAFDHQFIEMLKAVTIAQITLTAQTYFTDPAISIVGNDLAFDTLQSP